MKTTDTNWPVGSWGPACPEIALSQRLALLAREAETGGFPFTAEHLRHLAGFVLDETALKYCDGHIDSDDEAPDQDA